MEVFLPRLSVIVVHYKRTALAIGAINSIRRLGLDSIEFILADDGTPQLEIESLRSHFDEIIISSKNKGLGHNMNQGILASRGEYIMVMQEDTEYTGTKRDLVSAMAALAEHDDIDMIRLYDSKLLQRNKDAVTIRSVNAANTNIHVVDHKHELFRGNAYSDMPHIRRNPCRSIGQWMYAENCRMEQTEQDYVDRFAEGDKRVAFLCSSEDLIIHQGKWSSHRRSQWDYRLAKIIKQACGALGIDTKHPALMPIRSLIINRLPLLHGLHLRK